MTDNVNINFVRYCIAFLEERCGLTSLEAKILICDPELGSQMDEVKQKWAWEDLPSAADPDDFLVPKFFDAPEMKRINDFLAQFANEYSIRAPRIIDYLQSIGHPLGNSADGNVIEKNNNSEINYGKTLFGIFINIALTFWLFLFFVLEINEFINPIQNSDDSFTQTVPLLSTLGIAAWLGLLLRKNWGIFLFQGYLLFTILYQSIDLFSNFGLATIIQLSLTLIIGISLYFYFKRNDGFIWVVKKY